MKTLIVGLDGATGRDPVPAVQRRPGRVAPDVERRRQREGRRLEVGAQRLALSKAALQS